MPAATDSLGKVDLDDLKLTTKVIHGHWKTTILFFLARAPHRFGELRRAVVGISEKVLIQHLRELEADAIVTRKVERTVPPRVEYSLSAHGRTLCAAIEAMAAWGKLRRRYLDRRRRSPS